MGLTFDNFRAGQCARSNRSGIHPQQLQQPQRNSQPNMRPVEFSNRTFVTFLALQALDVLTTLIGLNLGATEGSTFVNRMLQFGPVTGLLISKGFSIVLVAAVVAFGRGRLMRVLNPWYAVVVTWNLLIIFNQVRA